jgi:predicted nucleic acid-binding protein
MRVLIDTNVILDYVLERHPFHAEAEEIVLGVARRDFVGYVSSITPINVYYTGRKLKGKDHTIKAVRRLLRLFEVCTADKKVLQKAFSSNISDYEDAVQHESAVAENLDAIVTRNAKDFANAMVKIYSPTEFLAVLQQP